MFELAAQKNRDQYLEDGTLNENYDNEAKDGVGSIPEF